MLVGQLSANYHQRQSNIAETARNPNGKEEKDENDNELHGGHSGTQRHNNVE